MFSEPRQNQKDIHLKHYFFVILNRKWWVLSFFIFTVTIISMATFIQKPIYRATATVVVDAETPNVLSVNDVVRLGESNYFAYRDYIETQKEIIRSRRSGHQVFKRLNLASQEEFSVTKKDPIEKLLEHIRVELVRNTRILQISADSRSQKLASAIANEFAKVYADSNLSLSIKMSGDAQTWLKEEVREQEKKMRDSEAKLQSYKEKNDIISPENKENIVSESLKMINANYVDAQARLIQIEASYKSIENEKGDLMLDNLPPVVLQNKTLEELKQNYLKQEALLVEYSSVYKEKHPKMARLLEQIAYLKSRIKNEIHTQYEAAKDEAMKLKGSLDEKKNEVLALERKTIYYNALMREVEINRRMLNMVLNRLKETSMSSQIRVNNIRVQDLAETPRRPIRPKKGLNIAASIILGLIGGISLAFFMEYMNTSLKDQSDIMSSLDLPILGSIPRIKVDRKNIREKSDIDRVVQFDAASLASEAYRSIRTNLLFSLNDSMTAKRIVITSSVPREGKTIVAANLSIMIASSGERVLLVDADMRKPRICKVFNITNSKGLSNYLSGEENFNDILNPSAVDNLSIITTGNVSHKSAELISSSRMKLFLEESSSRFSMVIFDTPPVTLITDAALLASFCSGVVLVAESGRTTKEILKRAKELLGKVNANIIGVIVNNISLSRAGYFYPQYYYTSYYKPVKT